MLNSIEREFYLTSSGGLIQNKTVPLPLYVFDNVALNTQSPLSFIRLPSVVERFIAAASKYNTKDNSDKSTTRQLFIGPAFSGAPFHFHDNAFNALIFGRKLWLLTPPGRDLYSNLHPLEWSEIISSSSTSDNFRRNAWPYYDEVNYRSNIPCSLEQNAGDVLYIPSQWSHQVLNLAESVGIATEVHS